MVIVGTGHLIANVCAVYMTVVNVLQVIVPVENVLQTVGKPGQQRLRSGQQIND
jgi:hypothetical protein